jgi:hypothetical protein
VGSCSRRAFRTRSTRNAALAAPERERAWALEWAEQARARAEVGASSQALRWLVRPATAAAGSAARAADGSGSAAAAGLPTLARRFCLTAQAAQAARASAAAVVRAVRREPPLRLAARSRRAVKEGVAPRAAARVAVAGLAAARSIRRRHRRAQARVDSNHDSRSSLARHRPVGCATQIVVGPKSAKSAFFQARSATTPHSEFCSGSIPFRQFGTVSTEALDVRVESGSRKELSADVFLDGCWLDRCLLGRAAHGLCFVNVSSTYRRGSSERVRTNTRAFTRAMTRDESSFTDKGVPSRSKFCEHGLGAATAPITAVGDTNMTDIEIAQGEERMFEGQLRVFYDGYWIKAYEVPADTLLAKKRLIDALTRRLFNHVEYGLNVPGIRLAEARRAFLDETDQAKKRVKGGMLAGALFNRAADIFTNLVELQACGVEIQSDNALMRQCGEHLQESLALGQMVLHRSGEEGIDELWGEPFKAFAFPIEEFYRSRYVKIALTMRAFDAIGDALRGTIAALPAFTPLLPVVDEFVHTAKLKSETLRTDPDVFEVWSSFVVACETLSGFQPAMGAGDAALSAQFCEVLRDGATLVSSMARARVPMPKSARAFLERCDDLRQAAKTKKELTPRPGALTSPARSP